MSVHDAVPTWASDQPDAMVQVSWYDIQAYAYAYHIQMLEAANQARFQLIHAHPYGVLPEFDAPLG